MEAIIKQSKARGTVEAPPSKSVAHRLLICASLAGGKSVIRHIALSQDILATLDCIAAFGAKYTYQNGTVNITGTFLDNVKNRTVLNCRESGSTFRFFIPIALLTGKEIIFRGSKTLLERPLGIYEELCAKRGFLFERGEDYVRIRGKLEAGEYIIPGNISSQFISGLLFALPIAEHLKSASIIKIIPPVESRPYIDMTLQALNEFGVRALWKDEHTLLIDAGQKYTAKNTAVEGDYSNAAFFEALNLAGGNVCVTGLDEKSPQGDKMYIDFFKLLKSGSPVIDISNCPDLGPVLIAGAAIGNGAVFTGTKRLKIKESDRAEAMRQELEKFGIKAEIDDNKITVKAGDLRKPTTALLGHNDHRIVMSLAILATITGGTIKGAQAVRKSFPDFFDKLKSLNIEVETSGMDQ